MFGWGNGRRRVGLLAIVTALIAAGLVTGINAAPAVAVPGSYFNAGLIISDAQFFNASAMSQGAVQSWLAQQPCTPSGGAVCLSNYQQTTTSRAAAANGCAAYTGASNELASAIIWKAAQACGISPEVLLVLVQKEQSLVSNPSPTGYQRATGYACPDSGTCATTDLGFGNQIYMAAWQFRQYTYAPGGRSFRIGQNSIAYSPNAACGSGPVTIQDQSTADLYIYTPYQPDAAALANDYGTGDSCSSYGNRNFWRIYYDWFGSPTDRSPIGQVENLQPLPGGVGIWGWAVDTDTTDPITMNVTVDGALVQQTPANGPRADVNSWFNLGPDHGFSLNVPTSPGAHNVCVVAVNVGAGSDRQFGCWGVTVGGKPLGTVENIQNQPGGVGIWGWAVDPDTTDPVMINYYVDGHMVLGALANSERDDIGQLKPGYGNDHGFAENLSMSPGSHSICAYAINVGSGTGNTTLGCNTVNVGGNPIGTLDPITTGIGVINASGWAVDPDTTNPLEVDFYLDGKMVVGTIANVTRTDLGVFANYGTGHGFSVQIPATGGNHTLCAYAINQGAGTNTALGCRPIQIGGPPIGSIENGQPGFASVNIWGWAYDPDTANPIEVDVYIDGAMRGGYTANVPHPGSSYPAAYGPNHGFATTTPTTPGTHQVCLYGINQGGGQNTNFGCFTTTVSGNPVGSIDNIQTVGTSLGVWGSAVDPDTVGPVEVDAYLDGVMVGGFIANQSSAVLATTYPGFGPNHAYGFEIPATQGQHQVCVYAINQGVGTTNTNLGCDTVTRN
jgi:hypothetical protein